MLTHQERVNRFETMRLEGRLIRNAWTRIEADGRERACWLAALSPESGMTQDARACPANVMPSWLAYMTPNIDDKVSDSRWGEFAKRYGRCAAGWSALNTEAWDRVEAEVKLAALAIARETVTTDKWGVLPAIDEVARLLREGGSDEEWEKAYTVAYDAYVAITGTYHADYPNYTVVTESTYYTNYTTACAALQAAACADRSTYVADTADSIAITAIDYDRIAVALFDAIDCEIATTKGKFQ